jgi:elongation factor P
MHIYLDGEVYSIVEFQHVKPGKGGAFVRTKLRKLSTGQNIEKTFRAGERVETAFVERKRLQYLYSSEDEIVCMDPEDYDQHSFNASLLGEARKYLTEGLELTAVLVDGKVVGLEVPPFVELKVVDTDPGFKGDTVSGGSKPATLEGGAVVNVPFHINVGDTVKVDTRTDTYLERVKTAE